jgi:hypothetical protein
MPREADFVDFLFPPMTYSVWWVIGAVLVVLLVVAWVVGVFVWTLPIEVLRKFPVIRTVAYKVLRFKFTRSLQKVGDRHRSGELETREAYHELSRIFRRFLAFRTGYTTREMTFSDIGNSELNPALDVMRLIYPGQFDHGDPRSVTAAVDKAKTAVATWV